MDAIDQLKQDVRDGRIGAEALIDLIARLSRKLDAAYKRIEELENRLGALLQPSSTSRSPRERKRSGKRLAARRNASASRRDDAVESAPTTKSGKLSESNPFSPKASLPTRVRCHMFGRCGAWRTVERCWSHTRFIGARATAMAKSPAFWAAASTVWRSSPRSPIWFMSSACPSTKSVFSLVSSRTCSSASRRLTCCFIGCRALGTRVRPAVHAPGQLAGGACRRDELEFEQRLGISLGEGSRAVVRCAQGCRDTREDTRSGVVRGHRDQRRRSRVRQLLGSHRSAGPICCARRSSSRCRIQTTRNTGRSRIDCWRSTARRVASSATSG